MASWSSEVEERIRVLGIEHGKAAGSWVIDGCTSRDSVVAILRGIEDGDPAVLDMLPSSPLSGEWADGQTPAGLLDTFGLDEACMDDACTAYEDGFSTGVVDEVERACLVFLGRDAFDGKARCYHVSGGEDTSQGWICDDCGTLISRGAVVEGEAPAGTDDLGPGRRNVNGRILYSAAWL